MKPLKNIATVLSLALLSLTSCAQGNSDKKAEMKNPYYSHTDTKTVSLSNTEWKKILSKGVYYIAREEGTERAYTGSLWDNHKAGTYYCAACGNKLFASDTKFESGTGWPSFYQPAGASSVAEKTDADGSRTEVECKRCGAHLGHVFDDGPKPTGLRYCMNSDVMDFEAKK
jgi:peptide-methionine (R)-S-oxide reductase